MVDPKKLESIIWEARARISWGDPQAEVVEWLQKQGVEQNLIDDLIRVSLKERDAEIRKRGVVEISIGGFILAVAASMLIGMFASGVAVRGIYVASGAAGIYGLYRISRGWEWLFVGGKVRGSITEMGDDGLS